MRPPSTVCPQLKVQMWDLNAPGAILGSLVGHTKQVYSVQLDSANPHRICSGGGEGTVRLWDTRTLAATSSLQAHVSAVMCVHIQDHRVITGGNDNNLKVFDLRTNRCLSQLEDHSGAIFSVSAFSIFFIFSILFLYLLYLYAP